ncbi:uncharacterized protein P884DRAFT_276130 [Thermothelomyces heterothallicus CBS 202.75]|uniref:uncharacterized protein n=1 Tax=Thermothelomyces heterothallicus CBS 202.75 TaxID=1149848 RepID=UPI00374218C7
MGGKVWSREEEEYFWLRLIPHSPKRLGDDIFFNEEKDWGWVGEMMTQYMGNRARRKYTQLCVFEHYFLNASLSRFSPNVGNLCARYWRHEQHLLRLRARALRIQQEAAQSDSEANASGESSTSQAESPIEVNSVVDQDTPIVINYEGLFVTKQHKFQMDMAVPLWGYGYRHC